MKKINKIIIKHEVDECPDLSWLGEFSNEPKGKFSIPHEPEDASSYNYFNAENVSNKGEAQQNYERMLAYGNDWSMVGIIAEAEVAVKVGDCWKLDCITSSGLWGIETDAEEEHHNEVANEQIDELKQLLREYGFSNKQIAEAPIEKV